MYDIRFHQPATISFCGSTGSGITTKLAKLIAYRNVLFDKPPQYVVLCYSQDQKIYNDLYVKGHVDKFIRGYPTYDELEKLLMPHKEEGSLLVFDDGLQGINDDITRFFLSCRIMQISDA